MAQDGDSHFGPQVEILQVMYYPQATPNESGPTCVQPLPCLLAASPFWRTGTPTGKQLDDQSLFSQLSPVDSKAPAPFQGGYGGKSFYAHL